jgi:hypothetical protein
MAIIRFSVLNNDIRILFLSDVERLTDIVEKHMQNNLANIRKLAVFYSPRHKYGIVDFYCDYEVDEYAIIPDISFSFNGEPCRIGFSS